MNSIEAKHRIDTDPDFINLKRFDFSMAKLIARYPDGCPDHIIANALLLSEQEVEDLYQQAVAKLRMIMGVTE